MAAIMNPLPAETNELLRLRDDARVRKFMNHPAAPKVKNPDENQLEALISYWTVIARHHEAISDVQVYEPGYMPRCEMLTEENGRMVVTKMN